MSAKLRARGKYAALVQHRGPDDPATIDAARDLATEGLAEHIQQVIDTAPALSADQVERLRGLLPPRAEAGGPDAA